MEKTPAIKLLESEHLALYVPDETFAEKMVDFLTRNQDYFKDSFHSYPEYYTANFWRRALANMINSFQAKRVLYLVLVLKEKPEKIIGNISIDGIIRGPVQTCYLGYKIDKIYAGKGLMFEALNMAIDYVFNEWMLHRIMANYRPENKDSEKLLKRLNFVEEGIAKDYMLIDGEWHDHVLTALVNKNFKVH